MSEKALNASLAVVGFLGLIFTDAKAEFYIIILLLGVSINLWFSCRKLERENAQLRLEAKKTSRQLENSLEESKAAEKRSRYYYDQALENRRIAQGNIASFSAVMHLFRSLIESLTSNPHTTQEQTKKLLIEASYRIEETYTTKVEEE